MNVNEAYNAIQKEYPNKSIIECLEFENFFAFGITDKGKEDELFGGGYETIDKKMVTFQHSIQQVTLIRL